MHTHRNAKDIAFIGIKNGVCSFQNYKGTVLPMNGQERATRPRALLSPTFIALFAEALESHLRVKLEIEHSKDDGLKIHFKNQPSAEALKTPSSYVITQSAADEHYLRENSDKKTPISLTVHTNPSGMDVICWILRSLYDVTFKATQTNEAITFEPPRGRTRYSTPPFKKIVTEPAPPPSSKTK